MEVRRGRTSDQVTKAMKDTSKPRLNSYYGGAESCFVNSAGLEIERESALKGIFLSTRGSLLMEGYPRRVRPPHISRRDDRRHRNAIEATVDFPEQLQYLFVDQAVIDQQMRSLESMGLSPHIGTVPSGLGHQQRPGGQVPGIQAELPERVETPAGDIGEVQRSRTAPSYPVRAHRQLVIEVDVHVLAALLAGKSGGDQRIGQAPGRGHVNLAIVEIRARTFFSREHFLAQGIVDHPRDHLVAPCERQCHVESRVAVGKIRGAVQGIYEPAVLRRAFPSAALLGHNGMVRIICQYPLYHQPFGGPVGFGHEIE